MNERWKKCTALFDDTAAAIDELNLDFGNSWTGLPIMILAFFRPILHSSQEGKLSSNSELEIKLYRPATHLMRINSSGDEGLAM